VNNQLLQAIKVARQDGRVDAIKDLHQRIVEMANWAEAKSADDQYHRGMRDGLIMAMEAIGLNRWETKRDTRSGK
jgi:hypothetical protein